MNLPWNERPLNGCLFEESPAPAATLMASSGAQLPAHVDLRPHTSPVEDQRKTNSCTANAAVGALEYHQIRAGKPVTDLSRLFVYYNARQLAGTEAKDVGSFIHHVMAAIIAHGACEERMWPFQEAMTTTRPTNAAFRDAQRFQAIQIARAPLGQATMASLAAGLPVVFGTYLPGEFYEEAASTGRMRKVTNAIETRPGSGHAMLLVGYDLGTETYIVRNSWGPAWADDGHVHVPMSTLAAYSDPNHYWTIGAIDQAHGVSITQAETSASVTTTAAAASDAMARLRASMRGAIEADLEARRSGFRERLRR